MPHFRHYHTNISSVTKTAGEDSLGFILFVPVVVVMFLVAACCRVCKGQAVSALNISTDIPSVPPVENRMFTLGNNEHLPESVGLQQRRLSLPGWTDQTNFVFEQGSVSLPLCSVDNVKAQTSFTEIPSRAHQSFTPVEATPQVGLRSSSIEDTSQAHQSYNMDETNRVHQSSITDKPVFVALQQPSIFGEMSDPEQISVSRSAKSPTGRSNTTSRESVTSGSNKTTTQRIGGSTLARLLTFHNLFSYKPLRN